MYILIACAVYNYRLLLPIYRFEQFVMTTSKSS